MSITRKTLFWWLLALPVTSSFALTEQDYVPAGQPINPFNMPDSEAAAEGEEQPPEASVETSLFCQQSRAERDRQLAIVANLKSLDMPRDDDTALCFSAQENLLFVANQEAEVELGPVASWYDEISENHRSTVEVVCKETNTDFDDVFSAYDRCVKNRYKEMMSPHEERYQREAVGYIRKRQQMALTMVAKCQSALTQKRPLLPRDLTFPLALFDQKINTIPSWILEKGLLDDVFLSRAGSLRVKDVMQAALGSACPGNMVLWVTYQAPAGT